MLISCSLQLSLERKGLRLLNPIPGNHPPTRVAVIPGRKGIATPPAKGKSTPQLGGCVAVIPGKEGIAIPPPLRREGARRENLLKLSLERKGLRPLAPPFYVRPSQDKVAVIPAKKGIATAARRALGGGISRYLSLQLSLQRKGLRLLIVRPLRRTMITSWLQLSLERKGLRRVAPKGLDFIWGEALKLSLQSKGLRPKPLYLPPGDFKRTVAVIPGKEGIASNPEVEVPNGFKLCHRRQISSEGKFQEPFGTSTEISTFTSSLPAFALALPMRSPPEALAPADLLILAVIIRSPSITLRESILCLPLILNL